MLAFACYVALGTMASLLSVAWPSIRVTFGLPLDALAGLLVATTIGVVIGSVLSAQLMARLGVGWSLTLANALSILAAVGYVVAPTWGVMLAAREQYEDALDELVESVRIDRTFADGAARKAMLAIFDILGLDSEVTKDYQRRLSGALF